MKEINKIIEVSAACCVQLGLGTLLIPKLLRFSVTLQTQPLVVINIHKNKVYFISFKHAFTETSFNSADMRQAEDRCNQNQVVLQHRFHSELAVVYLFNKVKNKCQYNKIWHICLCHCTIFIFNDIRKFVCCTSR